MEINLSAAETDADKGQMLEAVRNEVEASQSAVGDTYVYVDRCGRGGNNRRVRQR